MLYSFLKGYLKDIIEKDKIKQLLEKPEFKTNFDLLKSQMNQLNELKNISITDVRKKSKILTDDDVINIICEEFNKQRDLFKKRRDYSRINSNSFGESTSFRDTSFLNQKKKSVIRNVI